MGLAGAGGGSCIENLFINLQDVKMATYTHAHTQKTVIYEYIIKKYHGHM